MSVKVSPLKKEINLSSKAVNIKLCHSQKINRIFLELSVKVEPYVFEANLKLYKLENLMFLGKHKHLEI